MLTLSIVKLYDCINCTADFGHAGLPLSNLEYANVQVFSNDCMFSCVHAFTEACGLEALFSRCQSILPFLILMTEVKSFPEP